MVQEGESGVYVRLYIYVGAGWVAGFAGGRRLGRRDRWKGRAALDRRSLLMMYLSPSVCCPSLSLTLAAAATLVQTCLVVSVDTSLPGVPEAAPDCTLWSRQHPQYCSSPRPRIAPAVGLGRWTGCVPGAGETSPCGPARRRRGRCWSGGCCGTPARAGLTGTERPVMKVSMMCLSRRRVGGGGALPSSRGACARGRSARCCPGDQRRPPGQLTRRPRWRASMAVT